MRRYLSDPDKLAKRRETERRYRQKRKLASLTADPDVQVDRDRTGSEGAALADSITDLG